MRNTILVPTDLTYVANRAIDHSLELAKLFNLKICLLHVVSQNTTYSEKEKIKNHLQSISEFSSRQSGVEIFHIIREGNIFDDIADMADDIFAEIIVMGIHGDYGGQNVLGSFAYSVIRSSKVPVMIVKQKNIDIQDNHIVVPVDYSKINKYRVETAIKFAKYFNCAICVTGDVFYGISDSKKGDLRKDKELFLQNIAEQIKKSGIEVKTNVFIKPKTILVPMDFTPGAEKALEHAIDIAKTFDRRICLLHVIGEKSVKAEKEKVENQLKLISSSKSEQSGIEISYLLKEGSIFDVITATVSEISAGFVVMAYHGNRDVRNLSRGFAYNVIRGSRVPVMISKKNNTSISSNTIVVPIDFAYEKLKKINKAARIAKHYDCHVNVIGIVKSEAGPDKCDKEKLLKTIKECLENEGVKHTADIREKPSTILVPTDFTQVADFAINHAIEAAKLFNRRVVLLHVIGKNATKKEENEVEAKLNSILDFYKKETSVDISYEIKPGSIFTVISNTATDVSAEFIFMGIHGKKGLQHITGSYAYKVITSSKVPVLVLKRKYKWKGFDNIVVPVDFSEENREDINTAIRFAKYFDSTLHIIVLSKSRSSAYNIQQEAMLANIVEHVENSGIRVNAEILIIPGAGIHEKILEYSKNVGADLLMIVAKKGGKIAEVLGHNYAEKIIIKADLPVLTITSNFEYYKEPTDVYSFGYFIDPFGLTKN